MRLIVFDWDGTLLDSTALIADSIQRTCHDLSLPIPEVESAKFVIGMGLLESIKHIVPTLKQEHLPNFVQVFRNHYLPREHQLSLFPGVRELLDDLNKKEVLLAVATGKPRQGLDRSIANNGLEGVFAMTRCADESRPKPHPEMLEFLLERGGVSAKDTLMVGDTTHDLQMAKHAQVRAIAVSYGAHPAHLLKEEPHLFMAHTLTELHQWFMDHF